MRIERRVPVSDTESLVNLQPFLRRIFAARGVQSESELDNSLSRLLPPTLLAGIEDAVGRLERALGDQQKILIIGDFDADGATSCALGVLVLRALGANVDYLVPNRFEYGYGLTPEIVNEALELSPDLLITVDNGISSIAGVEVANAAGVDVLITDHHLPGEQLPDALAIVNPNQPGCAYPSKALAGVGVLFSVLAALRSRLRENSWFDLNGVSEPNLAEFLDLVALGTVADVVPLDHNNRILVAQGLARMRCGNMRPGISALLEVADRNPATLTAADLGFAIGPRLNAAGRLDDMSVGIECLLASDFNAALVFAKELDALNRDRRVIETGMRDQAMAALDALTTQSRDKMPIGLCVYDADWHQGVIGILAARLRERYHRPVIAFADAGDGLYKGSARSLPGFHIRDALAAVDAKHPGLLHAFGGHAMAAGVTLDAGNYDAFQATFDAEVRATLEPYLLEAKVLSDGELESAELTLESAQLLRDAGPWGQQFPEPTFDGHFFVRSQRLVGERHLKLALFKPDQPSKVLDAIAFNIDPEQWPDHRVEQVELVYRLDINNWRDRRSLQLIVEHIAPLHR